MTLMLFPSARPSLISLATSLLVIFLIMGCSDIIDNLKDGAKEGMSTTASNSTSPDTGQASELSQSGHQPIQEVVYQHNPCFDAANQSLNVEGVRGTKTLTLLNHTTYFFGAKTKYKPLFHSQREPRYQYDLYAYIGGDWVEVSPSASSIISGGRRVPGRFRFDYENSTAQYQGYEVKVYQDSSQRYTIPLTPLANKYSLNKGTVGLVTKDQASTTNFDQRVEPESFLSYLPLSPEDKEVVAQGFRRRSWYGPQFGMALDQINTFFDLAPYRGCLGRYKDTSSGKSLTHRDAPFMVFSDMGIPQSNTH